MAAGPLAHAVDGPILLVDSVTGMPTWLADEAARACSDTATAYLIGGADVVPASVEADLAARGFEVVRISGRTRYETAVAVAEELDDPTRVVIATGEDFPDALTASAPAAKMGAPVLFSFGESLRPAVRDYLEDHPDISRAYVIGEDDVVSAAVEDELEDLVGRRCGSPAPPATTPPARSRIASTAAVPTSPRSRRVPTSPMRSLGPCSPRSRTDRF
jgi:putative cell wall-binding protein